MTLRNAAPIWMELRRPYLKPRSQDINRQYLRALLEFFGDTVLREIHIGQIQNYQAWRKPAAGPSWINHEVNTLSQILRRADLWEEAGRHYEALPLPRWTPPRVLTEAQEAHLFAVASRNPNWDVAYWVASITSQTSAHGCELRGLRLSNIDLQADPPRIYIPSDVVKNEFRARVVPLNGRALIQVKRLLQRAADLGSTRPEHYLFPFRVKRGMYDPTRPPSPSFIRTAFREMKTAAGFPWLRPGDLRHQCITKLFEAGARDEAVTSIAGHQSARMSQHYSHIRIANKMKFLDAINPDARKPSQKTGHIERRKQS